MIYPICTLLKITVCDDALDAVNRGYDWNATDAKPIEVKEAVVVRNGTVTGKATTDFLLEDEKGQKYVFMITNALLRAISSVAPNGYTPDEETGLTD